jgi:arsenate reductase (thioredoxin)
MKKELRMLFLCTHNSCRSQMAEGWAKALRGQEIVAFSAGTEPAGVDPRAVQVMREAGVDISGQRSKSLMELKHLQFDYVVTMCGSVQETCPVFPGVTKVVHHGFDDPPQLARDAATEEEALDHYRRIRDEIKLMVIGLPDNLEKESVGMKDFILDSEAGL